MKYTGTLLKMDVEHDIVVNYYLQLNEGKLFLNPLISKNIRLEYQNQITCVHCNKTIKKAFGEGYCYPCFISVPQTEDCVLRPELCKAHEGVARDMDYAQGHCLIDHFVYLAISGGTKIGVTRHTQIPVRWIDQGATAAILFAKTPNRYLAGLIEVSQKKFISDKTNWRNMLQGKKVDSDLIRLKENLYYNLTPDFTQYFFPDNTIQFLNYPVLQYPVKVNSINLDNTPVVEGILTGIKGQYLILDNGNVFNIRRHSGYLISLESF